MDDRHGSVSIAKGPKAGFGDVGDVGGCTRDRHGSVSIAGDPKAAYAEQRRKSTRFWTRVYSIKIPRGELQQELGWVGGWVSPLLDESFFSGLDV